MPKNISTDTIAPEDGGRHRAFSAFGLGATHSGGGKTTLTLALLRALRRRGLRVQPFKCGPDYIDTAFHQRAAGRPSINLDTWMMGETGVLDSFGRAVAGGSEVAVVEGVMGLFDGFSPGSLVGSTADCARLLRLPVVLVVDAKGMAGSIAPLVKGFAGFHQEIEIRAVVANRVGSCGHTEILATALEKAGLPPLIGGLPNNPAWRLEERHLGLTPVSENDKSEKWFDELATACEEYLDLDRLLRLSRVARPRPPREPSPPGPARKKIRLALAFDAAFNFYYPDNLRLLRQAGFEIVEFSPLTDETLPAGTRMVMIGGGFPEMFAARLAANERMRGAIRAFADEGGMIYAECGGYMYLGETLTTASGEVFPMCGVIPGHARMTPQLRSLGYREVTTLDETIFGPAGTRLRGHEFHWSEMELAASCPPLFRQKNRRGEVSTCGIRQPNVQAGYIHLHFAATPRIPASWHERVSASCG